MELKFEIKYIVVMLQCYNIKAWSKITYSDKQEIFNIGSQKISNAQENIALQWPKGVVAYYFDNFSYDYHIAQRVRIAMNVLETVSCVRFKPILVKPRGNITWIHFTNPLGERQCAHKPDFQNDGEIVLILGYDCLKEREIIHTLLHAIGFEDEVTHPQRDQYIRVMWNNIQPEYRHLYHIRSSHGSTSKLLVEYDPQSIMHFHDRAFSINGHATIMPLIPGLLISPSSDLSQLDKMRLRLLFDHECNKRKVGDVIDTCKTLLNSQAKLNDANNITDPKSEDNPDDRGDKDKVCDSKNYTGKQDNVDAHKEDIGEEDKVHIPKNDKDEQEKVAASNNDTVEEDKVPVPKDDTVEEDKVPVPKGDKDEQDKVTTSNNDDTVEEDKVPVLKDDKDQQVKAADNIVNIKDQEHAGSIQNNYDLNESFPDDDLINRY